MGVLSDLIDGIVQITESTVDATGEKLRGLFALSGVIIVLLFLLILFAFYPMMALALGIVLVLAVAYVLANNDGGLV